MKKHIWTGLISGALGICIGFFIKKKRVAEKLIIKEVPVVKEVPAELNNLSNKTTHKFPYESLSFSLSSPFFSLPEAQTIIHNDAAYIPLSFFKEYLNISTYYIKEQKEILIETTDKRISLKLNKKIAKVDGKTISISYEPISVDNEIFVPLTEIFEVLGCRIYRDEEFGEVKVYL